MIERTENNLVELWSEIHQLLFENSPIAIDALLRIQTQIDQIQEIIRVISCQNGDLSPELASVLHDFRGPFSTIIFYRQLLEKLFHAQDMVDYVPTRLVPRPEVQAAENASWYGLVLATSLQQLISQEHQQRQSQAVDQEKLQLTQTELNDLILKMVSALSPKAIVKSVEILLNLDENLPPVMVDSHQTMRVIANIIANAIKYTPDGGTVTITTDRVPLIQNQSSKIRLIISDTGIGIPTRDGDLEYVFQRRMRADNVGQIRGTGLGLATVKQIADNHGWGITLTSRLGQGSTFIITIPVSLSKE